MWNKHFDSFNRVVSASFETQWQNKIYVLSLSIILWPIILILDTILLYFVMFREGIQLEIFANLFFFWNSCTCNRTHPKTSGLP